MKEKRIQKMLKVMERLLDYGVEFKCQMNTIEFKLETPNDDIAPIELFFFLDGDVAINSENLTEEEFDKWFNENV